MDECKVVDCSALHMRSYALCAETCLEALKTNNTFGLVLVAGQCGHGGGGGGLADTICTSFSASFNSFTCASGASVLPRSLSLRAACAALNNASDCCRLCDRLEDTVSRSLKSLPPNHTHLRLHAESALNKLHEHFLISSKLAESVVVDVAGKDFQNI
jgi:hypothetical protein